MVWGQAGLVSGAVIVLYPMVIAVALSWLNEKKANGSILPGWIAHWKEMHDDPNSKINRPRQIYVGETARPWIDRNKR